MASQTCSCNEANEILVFRPTLEEFKDFSAYVKYIESKGAHKGGIAKIIPPKEWKATRRYNMKTIGELEITTPVSQTITGQQGSFQLFNISKKKMKVKEYKELAESGKYKPPDGDPESLERKYWKNITFNAPVYGADVPGSIYDKDQKYWNVNKLGTILDVLESEWNVKILGVNTAYLYFGMWKATFPWHTEDMDLYSINYLHFGASKFWYAIPPEQGRRLETLATGFFPGSAQECPEFMRHKMTIISPQVLKKFSIPVNKVVQNEGEFIITFPYGYHSGFNQGFNCAESTNFASERWIDFGKKARHCQCKGDSVKIDMNVFIRHFQPDQWKEICLKKKEFKKEKRKVIKKSKSKKAKISNKKERISAVEVSSRLSESSTDAANTSSDSSSSAIEDTEEESTDSMEESSTSRSQKNPQTTFSNKKNMGLRKLAIPKKRLSQQQLRKNIQPKQIQKSKRHPVHSSTLDSQSHSESSSSSNSDSEDADDSDVEANSSGDKSIGVHKEKKLEDIEGVRNTNMELLYSYHRYNQEKEKNFNTKLSLTHAQCAVCVYFSQVDAGISEDNASLHASQHRKILVSELCFAELSSTEEQTKDFAFDLMFGEERKKESKLYRCDTCALLVHDFCYGVNNVSTEHSNIWYCDKCKYLQSLSKNEYRETVKHVKCVLCPLRGGALKKTTDGHWCHIVCAITFPDVTFVNPTQRGCIDVTKLTPARKKLSCSYCYKKIRRRIGACIQCKSGKCAVPFHVTCSFHHGIPLYLGDWPVLIETFCKSHIKVKTQVKLEKRERAKVSTGDIVFAKHKNTRYYQGTVLDVTMKLFYEVVFEDKSFCLDLPPQDIQDHDTNGDDDVIVNGETVKVLWTDGLIYNAEVKGHYFDPLCQVRFEDGSTLAVKRSDVYLENEALPKRIQSKISYASETANKLYQVESVNRRSRTSSTSSSTVKNEQSVSS